ncbi:hypothetical protein [Pseudomonas sp. DrBHI1]|uniref:hypothetical protein n=1 Tax=Pseudomonas sp. DrBHI1 TaxID=2006091 RepID=UPI000B5899CD|nr:hypothetical protein [Pseudomonas sp. DrBHI1]OWQ36532.1 hypothetical protein CC207_08480 [Pseudomonas sp. DrBHI1]
MSQAKERPILFNGPMVRAILEGRKTVTRRAVKEWQQPRLQDDGSWFATAQRHPRWGFGVSGIDASTCAQELSDTGCCPYGRPGERLWVRETFADIGCRLTYRADLDDGAHCAVKRWTPSLHMRRIDSRILLEITAVRVERLQDLSDDQAKAEGMVYTDFGMQERPGKVSLDGGKTFHPMKPRQAPGWHAGDATHPDQCLDRARWAFANLWEKINGQYSWDANPWVWVVEFKRIQP